MVRVYFNLFIMKLVILAWVSLICICIFGILSVIALTYNNLKLSLILGLISLLWVIVFEYTKYLHFKN